MKPIPTAFLFVVLIAISGLAVAVEPASDSDPVEQVCSSRSSERSEPGDDPGSCDPPPEAVSPENRRKMTGEISEGTQDALTLKKLLLGQSYLWFGRVDVDYAAFQGEPLSDEDGFEPRRLQVGIAGIATFFDNVSYKLEVDFTDGTNNLSDVFMQIDSQRAGSTRIGNQRISQGLAAYTSSLSQLFMERALPVEAFSLARRIAISHSYNRHHGGVHGMYYGGDVNNEAGRRGWALRAFANPVRNLAGLAHLGVSFVSESIDGDGRVHARPETRVTDISLVDTGVFEDVKRHKKLGLELAGSIGSTTGRLEIFGDRWEREGGANNEFKGAYLEISRFFTGQSLKYKQGKFIRPTIEEGSRAWEGGLRVSWVDLNSKDVQGGEQLNIGLALNYYARQNLRVMFNILHFSTDDVAGDDQGWILQTRFQYNH